MKSVRRRLFLLFNGAKTFWKWQSQGSKYKSICVSTRPVMANGMRNEKKKEKKGIRLPEERAIRQNTTHLERSFSYSIH
jgi:hypothetical protein